MNPNNRIQLVAMGDREQAADKVATPAYRFPYQGAARRPAVLAGKRSRNITRLHLDGIRLAFNQGDNWNQRPSREARDGERR
jgi:hypothetical protein